MADFEEASAGAFLQEVFGEITVSGDQAGPQRILTEPRRREGYRSRHTFACGWRRERRRLCRHF